MATRARATVLLGRKEDEKEKEKKMYKDRTADTNPKPQTADC